MVFMMATCQQCTSEQ